VQDAPLPGSEQFLDPAEVAPLFAGLHDASAEVRVAMLEALTRLPLAPSDRMKVGAYGIWVFESTSPLEERLAMIDLAPWVPLRRLHELVARLAVEGEEEEVRTCAADAAARLARAEAQPAGFEGSPLHPAWADGEPPGFTTYSASDRSTAGAELATLLPDGGRPTHLGDPASWWVFELDEPSWTLDQRVMDPVLGRDLAPAAVTALFERVVAFEGNHIVGWVQGIQGRFRPDLDGLFARYWRLAVERGFDHPFVGPLVDDEAGPRPICWQIGWTVSRGGLRGLVPGLAPHLADGYRTERMAAAFLIADAADYVLQVRAPIFGGAYAPERRAYEPLPGLEEPVAFDSYVCPRGDYRWPVLGPDDPVAPPQECEVHHLPLVFRRAGADAG
jgi:hypothetical protein